MSKGFKVSPRIGGEISVTEAEVIGTDDLVTWCDWVRVESDRVGPYRADLVWSLNPA